ncbi:uncharacterized protein LOC129766091 [Toxorhynchites rutilus septentrionalis]|uniref:uncharacterized protein LOC129766091 n=1 Tax=Toxorhynchites rutilus septentrionalis TaxID=329112 RepID=UPI00247A6F5B|nr:uncharacterized protein LOC129766091 [Toxorhynchites rutilus septentrionalis]
MCQTVAVSESLENLMNKFWECEDGRSLSNNSIEEAKCEEHFVKSVKRNEDGRYIVGLPKSDEALARLGESKSTAIQRLKMLERRLGRDRTLKNEYHAFMAEYLAQGHMKKVVNDHTSSSIVSYYLPHHPVIKNSSTTTRVRVVFDASSKTSTGMSLNDALLNGPVIQDDLRSIIMRSRLYPIVLIADVEKMFRQVLIDPADLPLQRIIWRFSTDEPIEEYELCTVTYGTKPAPFLATRTLKQLSLDEAENFPHASRKMARDVYMDDIITGASDVSEAKTLRKQLDDMLLTAGFRLRKWASNDEDALEGVEHQNLALPLINGINLDSEQTIKTLGLMWEPITDNFRFNIECSSIPTTEMTKRKVLSCIARIFDPLGLVGPVVTKAKIFMQRIWELKNNAKQPLDWDEILPQPLLNYWMEFHKTIPELHKLRIPRFAKQVDSTHNELHCFSDASEQAYGACMYLRSQDANGLVKITLLSSKSRVSPLKRQTIPRLELCGAKLAAEIYIKGVESLNNTFETFFWTDSKTVLQWLKQPPNTWNTFVAHRVAFIQHSTQNCQWRHVPGVCNPADQLSRGLTAQQLIEDFVWWNGPDWLHKAKDLWPNPMDISFESNQYENERRKTVVATVASQISPFNSWYFGRFSEYSALIRITAILQRYLQNLKTPDAKRVRSEPLSPKELLAAEMRLVQLVQQETFCKEIKALSKGEYVHRDSKLRWFNPRLSSEGIIRIGGRLENAELYDDVKHPMVIPGNHQFSKLLAVSYHKRLLHAGPQLMLNEIRQRFWPLGGRNLCRTTVHHCLSCYRAKPQLLQQFMGQLPVKRVTASRPFTTTGVDYFGPVFIRQGYRRAPIKAYVAVFICFSTKAVHLELVSDLSTAKFIQALRRFTARRGKCSHIYSDNGTNFVGARNELRELLQKLQCRKHHEEIRIQCAQDGINWHFIPPSAPHFGGLWEAAVRSAKKHLLRILGRSSVSYEDFTTLLAQVEGCLNSRPLTSLTDDPTDLQPLTPAHFLVGSSLQALPDQQYTCIPSNRLAHWQQIQQQLQNFWRRWHLEYLAQLQARVKNWHPPVNIEPGRLVIIVDENQPSMKWKMARIHQVHPGNDGIVRVVTLRTSSGYLKRPVTKICLLPVTPTTESVESVSQDSTEIPNFRGGRDV